MGPNRLRSKCRQSFIPSEGLREDSRPCFSIFGMPSAFPGSLPLSSILKTSNTRPSPSHKAICLTVTLLLLTSIFKDSCDYTVLTQLTQDYFPILKSSQLISNLNSICTLNIHKSKIMASGPITSWQIDGETVETVADFIFLGSKITADGDCNHEIKRRLLLGRKVMTKLDIILKSRNITLPTKVHLVKAMVFPVVMYGCESWTIKKAERQRIDAFELWCCRTLLRVPWTAWRFNQSILKEISPGCSLEGLMLKLKLQYFGHLMQRADSLGKTLMLGKIEGRRRRG